MADLITLVNFDGETATTPYGGVTIDASGNLVGTTTYADPYSFPPSDGTVFEIDKIGESYAATWTTLASFDFAGGAWPMGSLVVDAAGDLFGTTSSGGSFAGAGTVFEIAKTASGYSAPTTLVNFTEGNGTAPDSTLIMDSAGDLFGTASSGGNDNDEARCLRSPRRRTVTPARRRRWPASVPTTAHHHWVR